MLSTRYSFLAIAVGTLTLVGGAALTAWKHTVRPLEEREAATAREFTELAEKLEEARRSIKEVQALEPQSKQAATDLSALHKENPASSALVWFPTRVKEQLARFKFPGAAMRVNAVRELPDLPGYARIIWETEIPVERTTRDIRNALMAILEIEAAEPFVRVQDIAIGPHPDDPDRHVATINVALLTPKP